MKFRRIYMVALLGLLLLAATPTAMAEGGSAALQIMQLRRATAGFHNVNAAAQAGYAQFLNCISMPGQGAMGVHFVNNKLVGNPAIDLLQPEALLYQPEDGKLKLMGVEYVVLVDAWKAAGHTKPPSLFGQTFNFTDSPNMFGLPPFYSLHAWVWKNNPAGTFAPWNPTVSCAPEMDMERMGTAR